MAKDPLILLCNIVAFAGIAVADEQKKDPLAVWEMHGAKTSRVQLLADGATDEGTTWEKNLNKLRIDTGDFTISPTGFSFSGRRKGGEQVRGRMLMLNILLAYEASTPPDVDDKNAANQEDSPTADNLLGAWELTAWNRKKDMQFFLSVDLRENGEVLDETRRIANWSVDRQNRVTLNFVDPRFENALLGKKNPDTLFGKAKFGSDSWTVTLNRIRPVSVWNTDQLGQITLYSNGRINGTNGLSGKSYWSSQGNVLEIGVFSCKLSPDRQTFSGQDSYGTAIKGALVATEK